MRPTVWGCLLVLLMGATNRQGAGPEEWQFDVVRLKNGRSLRGLLVRETFSEVRLLSVSRKPGARTVVIGVTLKRDEVAGLDRLDPAERDLLEARLKALDPTGRGETEGMARLELKPTPWERAPDGRGWGYESDYFTLRSNAPEDVVRRAAFKLEQVYAAYARFLPPRHEAARPTAILLAASQADYAALLMEQGRNLLNPAFYDEKHNQVVCGTELARLDQALAKTRLDNQRLRQQLKERRAALDKLYGGKVPAALLRQLQQAAQEVDRRERDLDNAFEEATKLLFRTLYHEAFHAYLGNFVYPPAEAEVPRWLNEGLAQLFEGAFVEGGELRVGHAERERLVRVQNGVQWKELVGLAELLRSGPAQFVVQHDGRWEAQPPRSASEHLQRQTSDRHYLTSWALAFHLTFERRLLGTPAMDRYVKALKRGSDPLQAFADLVGRPLPAFEKEFHAYLLRLRPDGTTGGQ